MEKSEVKRKMLTALTLLITVALSVKSCYQHASVGVYALFHIDNRRGETSDLLRNTS